MTFIKWQKEAQDSRNRTAYPSINDLFGDLFDNVITNDFRRWTTPAVNIIENAKEYSLQMAAPGLKKEDFKINMQENVLTISAEVKKEANESSIKNNRTEFHFGNFKRSFNLPETIAVEKITANYENGIMLVVLPKEEPVRPKTMEINIM